MTDPFGLTVSLDRTITKDTNAAPDTSHRPVPARRPGRRSVLYLDNTPITVKAYVEIGSKASLNGTPMTVDSQGVFTYSLPLVLGDNTITISATDPRNNTSTVSYVIKYAP